MIVPIMRTWVAGELVTAAYMNSNIRDLGVFILARPMAILRQTVAQSWPTGAWTACLFDTEDLDRDNGHSTVTNTARYVPGTPGYYWFSYSVGWVSNVTGVRAGRLRTNGSDTAANAVGRSVMNPAGGGSDSSTSGSGAQFCNGTGDYIELMGYQSSGGALNSFIAGDGVPRMQVLWASS